MDLDDLVLYDELLEKCLALDAPPHMILSFCFRDLMEQKPSEMAEAASRNPGEWTLWRMAGEFRDAHVVRTSGKRAAAILRPLLRRLQLPLGWAITERHWRAAHEGLIELHGRTVCGATSLLLYDSGRLEERLTSAKNEALRKGAVPRGFALLARLMHADLGLPYAWALERRNLPVREICAEVDRLCLDRGLDPGVCPGALAVDLPGGTLQQYETFRLPGDISEWASNIRLRLARELEGR